MAATGGGGLRHAICNWHTIWAQASAAVKVKRLHLLPGFLCGHEHQLLCVLRCLSAWSLGAQKHAWLLASLPRSRAVPGRAIAGPPFWVPGRLQARAKDLLQYDTCCRGPKGMLLCVVNGPAPVCGSCLLSAHSRGRLKTIAVQDSTGSLHSNHLAHHAHATSQKNHAGRALQ